MKVKIIRKALGSRDALMEHVLNVKKIEEKDLGLKGKKFIFECFDNEIMEINLKDILYMTPITIIKNI